ncbi:protein IWS1 homolog isoform X1 [Macrobrachium rosenbergii]|uniref:protein IWS1 homolog isoform X1 n=1 Tax=Macrobrachium rosenbergii TaxID=79674 RepID=UPI0034D47C1A
MDPLDASGVHSPLGDSASSDSEEEDSTSLKKSTRNSSRKKKGTAKKVGNSGKDHLHANNGKRLEKTIGPPCKCGCLKGIGEETVKKIFEEFWAIGDYTKQNAHLGTRLILVDDSSPDSQQGTNQPAATPLSRTVIYTVFYNNIVYKVCRQAFHSIHSIGEKRVRTVINKLRTTGVEGDQHKQPNKLNQAFVRIRQRIVQHILKATNGVLPAISKAGSSRFSIKTIYNSYLQSVDGLSAKYHVSYTYYREVYHDLLKKGQSGDETNTVNNVLSQHHCEDGETSKDSTSSNDAPTSKTSGKENVTTISNQDKKDKGNSSSTANPRLILPKVSLILVPCPTEVTKDSEVQPVLKLPAQETQSESQEPPKASESQDISNSQGPPNVSESQVLHDISDSQELLDISNNHVPPSVSKTQVLHNVSESQGSPGVSESQPVVQNAVKQQNGADNLIEILPMATSTPPLRNAPVKGKDSASESMKLSEIKEELLDFSDMCTDQDIPTEEGSLSPVHHRPLKTQENLETSDNDPLQLEFLPIDSNDATAPATDNSQPCGTDTPEKKKVRHTTNKRKRTDTPSKRKRRNERLDESEEHTGSNDAYIQTGKDDRMEENSCETFGKFIAIQLRQLPLKNALNLQMEIHNLIAQERLKVLQEEMKKPVRAVNKKPRDDTSVQKSSANRAAKNKPTYREETTVKTTTVNEEPKKKLRPVRKAASVIKHSKDSIQKEVPKKRTIRSRVSGSFVESSPVMPDAIVPQPSAIYTFGNESLLNISTKSEDYDDDDSYWDAPSPVSVKSEAESISSL